MSTANNDFVEIQNINFKEAEEECRKILKQLDENVCLYNATELGGGRENRIKQECEALAAMATGSLRLMVARWLCKEGISSDLFEFLKI